MSILIDVCIVAVVVICAVISAKHGFVRTVIEIAGLIAAIWLTFAISSPLANSAYDKFIQPAIVDSVIEAAENAGAEGTADIWEALPEFVKNNADKIGISKESFEENITSGISSGMESAVTSASQTVIKPIFVNILGLLFSVILLIILMFVVRILAKFLNKLFSFSIVGKLNSTLGGMLGILKGIAVAFAFCMAVSLIVSLTDNGFLIFTPENIEKTVIFKALTAFSPFK